jgi:hippurate hydrolase
MTGSDTEQARSLLATLVSIRRSIHMAPEVGLRLPNTRATLLSALAPLRLETKLHERSSSFSVVVHGDQPGPVVLLRADMDALPIREETGLPFASSNAAMHACGHDMHAAALVGAAHLLSDSRSTLAGSVVLMFQAGEEGHGGARLMLDEGLLDVAGERPIAAFAIHVIPGSPGVFSTRSGTMLAGASELHVAVTGTGGHGARPQLARDPVPPVAEIVLALQTMVSRRFDFSTPVTVSVTQLSGSDAINVIPNEARLGATVRTLSPESVGLFEKESAMLVHGIAAAHGCTASVRLDVQFPVTVNDVQETARARAALIETFGEHRVEWMPDPMMASDDFSYVLDEVPGVMLALTASPATLDQTERQWNHSPRVLFDDGLLADQARALAALAISRLNDP